MAKPERLFGKHVVLRPLTRDDLDLRLKWVNDPEVQRMSVGITTSGNDEYDMRVWFHMVSEDPLSEQWAVELADAQGVYAGDVDLHSIMGGEATISPLFADPRIRPRPMRQDVLETILRYGFEQKGLQTVWAQIPDTDRDTLAVMEQLGFERVEVALLDFIEGVSEVTLRLDRAVFRPD